MTELCSSCYSHFLRPDPKHDGTVGRQWYLADFLPADSRPRMSRRRHNPSNLNHKPGVPVRHPAIPDSENPPNLRWMGGQSRRLLALRDSVRRPHGYSMGHLQNLLFLRATCPTGRRHIRSVWNDFECAVRVLVAHRHGRPASWAETTDPPAPVLCT
jgi:hypothetical protein